MQIYKFGGASLKKAEALKTIIDIISDKKDLVIVVSAIDKTTNKLEKLVDAYLNNEPLKLEIFEKIKSFHINFVKSAFGVKYNEFEIGITNIFNQLKEILDLPSNTSYDEVYDSIACYGELLSSYILSTYLNINGVENSLVDIRNIIVTDSNFRDAKILWEESKALIKNKFLDNNKIYITQGFIGRDKFGKNTSLGREGSDYTASGLAYLLDAECVVIWKDVPGIMNADPSICNFAEKLDYLSFREAIELAFYGAKVIHPKTIKPLENKNIPLYVNSFVDYKKKGTEVKKIDYKLDLIPIYIFKANQILLSVSPKDFSFVVEENISKLFALFTQYKIKVNITQNSAISFSAAIDGNNRNFDKLIEDLSKEYFVKYNTDLQLVTIRYYTDDSIVKMTSGKRILLEQRSRTTARFVLQ
ncbi:MAG: aspartate kinase [Bacteroidales bacterium]|nr:aspartate kinase [Bacteroidales bacterium]